MPRTSEPQDSGTAGTLFHHNSTVFRQPSSGSYLNTDTPHVIHHELMVSAQKRHIDRATILGIVSSLALLLIAIFMGGSLKMFWDLPSIFIVIGGTMGVTMINYSMRDIKMMLSVIRNVFMEKKYPIVEYINQFVAMSNRARRNGILSLEQSLQAIKDPFMAKGLQMAIDGVSITAIKEILEAEIESVIERHQTGASIFTSMGTYAPALGMVGTLIGLVQMLRTMNDPATIGSAMAVAIITTFYGAVLANMVFLPMSGKLRNRSSEEILLRHLIMNGILAIAQGDHPRIIEKKLQSFIPYSLRNSSFK